MANKTDQRALRDARKAAQTARANRRRLNRLLITAGVVVVVATVVVWGVWAATRPKQPAPGVPYPIQGATHINIGEAHPAYNSNPPTSGWHFPSPAAWGYYAMVLPDELVVHNLEHGGIWISYRDASDTQLIEKLEGLTRRFRSKLIVTQRPTNDSPIAVAAWGRLMKLDRYDEQQILAFFYAYRDRGPERVPD